MKTAGSVHSLLETFKKCSILFKSGECENSNPPDHHRDSQGYLALFRGLEFKPDAACPAMAFGEGGSF
jgi:hypothetical protein